MYRISKHESRYTRGATGGKERGEVRTGLMGDLLQVGSLDLKSDTLQTSSESVLGGRVHHLLLDLGAIGRPGTFSLAFERGP
jgi:hypothetical protein